MIAEYPAKLCISPRLAELVITNTDSNRTIALSGFLPCTLPKHLHFSLEIGRPKGIGIKECTIRRVINRGSWASANPSVPELGDALTRREF